MTILGWAGKSDHIWRNGSDNLMSAICPLSDLTMWLGEDQICQKYCNYLAKVKNTNEIPLGSLKCECVCTYITHYVSKETVIKGGRLPKQPRLFRTQMVLLSSSVLSCRSPWVLSCRSQVQQNQPTIWCNKKISQLLWPPIKSWQSTLQQEGQHLAQGQMVKGRFHEPLSK